MLIFRSQGHLLFSKWTISQRTVSVRAEALFRSLFVSLPAPLVFADVPAIWVGKITTSDPYSQALVKTFTLLAFLLSLPTPQRGPSKNFPSKRAAKVRIVSQPPNSFQSFRLLSEVLPGRSPEAGAQS